MLEIIPKHYTPEVWFNMSEVRIDVLHDLPSLNIHHNVTFNSGLLNGHLPGFLISAVSDVRLKPMTLKFGISLPNELVRQLAVVFLTTAVDLVRWTSVL